MPRYRSNDNLRYVISLNLFNSFIYLFIFYLFIHLMLPVVAFSVDHLRRPFVNQISFIL